MMDQDRDGIINEGDLKAIFQQTGASLNPAQSSQVLIIIRGPNTCTMYNVDMRTFVFPKMSTQKIAVPIMESKCRQFLSY